MFPLELIDDIIIPFMGLSIETVCIMRKVSPSMMQRYLSLSKDDVLIWSRSIDTWKSIILHDNIYLFSIITRLLSPKKDSDCVVKMDDIIDLCYKNKSRKIFHFMMDHSFFHRKTLSHLRQIPNIGIAIHIGLITLEETYTLIVCMRCYTLVIIYILNMVERYMDNADYLHVLSFIKEEGIPLPMVFNEAVYDDELI